MRTNIAEMPNITEIPKIELKCRYCDDFSLTCRLGIEDKEDIEKREELLSHYREEHNSDFMSYCGCNEPFRLKPVFLYSEGLELLESNKEEALERFLEAESLLLEDSLLLVVRLGTFRETEKEIKKLTTMPDRVVQLTELLDELEPNTDKNLEE